MSSTILEEESAHVPVTGLYIGRRYPSPRFAAALIPVKSP
jgi:hypothetical protein